MRKQFVVVGVLAGLSCLGVAEAADNMEGLARTCFNCHGTGGVSAGTSMPSIAGLPEAYLKSVMLEWKRGERASANMTRLVKGYTDDEIAGLAAYFAKQPWTPVPQPAAKAVLAKGRKATERCESCHGATGGQPDEDDVPKLNGQWAKYLELELAKYRDDSFQMTHKRMIRNARKMGAGDVEAAAGFYGAQGK
ncbi:hypothetical protein EZJ19_04050 [Parasulfuritortus cantonensis]|uniref:Cytochrome c domain-containing protein n=1 Tax=Parasulfuritortus cantonensis TaxID=2528202 RepID=A0A4R1BIL6_9PROT|nr:c-type cytochrome [Parasulfuritortus cantonensis]TCJ17130.1 hypothetical protein EZJ19_04050 [Parasulfuritortus cantonensis]